MIPSPFTSPVRMKETLNAPRLCLRGEGPVGNDPTGPKIIFDHAGDGISLGKGDPFRATGTSLRDCGIIKGKGQSGGTALLVAAYNERERPGESVFERFLILGESDLDGSALANWDDGIVVSAPMLRTINEAGARVIRFRGGRIAGCLGDAIRLENAVHCWVLDTQVDPGSAKNIPIVRIVGGDHVFLIGVNITGRIVIEGNARNVYVSGYAQEVVVRKGCRNVVISGIVEKLLQVEQNVTGTAHIVTPAVLNQSPLSFTVLR